MATYRPRGASLIVALGAGLRVCSGTVERLSRPIAHRVESELVDGEKLQLAPDRSEYAKL